MPYTTIYPVTALTMKHTTPEEREAAAKVHLLNGLPQGYQPDPDSITHITSDDVLSSVYPHVIRSSVYGISESR